MGHACTELHGTRDLDNEEEKCIHLTRPMMWLIEPDTMDTLSTCLDVGFEVRRPPRASFQEVGVATPPAGDQKKGDLDERRHARLLSFIRYSIGVPGEVR